MKTLRKPTKSDLLLNLFDEVGISLRVNEVCEITGISSYASLRAFCTYIRKSPHVPDEARIDIRISDGHCIRVN